jgi:transposase
MAQKPLSMNHIRRILQLMQSNVSERSIAKQCSISRTTVRSYAQRILQINLELDQLLELDDKALSDMMHEAPEIGKGRSTRFDSVEDYLVTYASELKKTGVTKELLWQEYRLLYPTGYEYTQFCHYLSLHIGQKETVMHFLHRMGEKMMVDFAGKTMSYTDELGEIIPCQVFVAVLPYSGYSYVEAVRSQKQQDFVSCLENALHYMGGVPECIVSDNLKSYVKRASRYEPEFTELVEQFSVHYNTAVMAARIRKPRDKASVEKAVHLTYQRVYAPLRNQQFRSLKEMNHAILGQLTHHHGRGFRGGKQTRQQLFAEESLYLKPLPKSRIEIKQRIMAMAQKNYHVLLGEDRHFYSVPYNHVGKQLQIVYTSSTVEIYLQYERIAIHPRQIGRKGYSTNADHMPPNHRHYAQMKGWDADYFKTQAENISPEVLQVIEAILQSRKFQQQAYNACLGILRLGSKYGNERLTRAAALSLQSRMTTYKFVSTILRNNTDLREKAQAQLFTIPENHDNVRGAKNYQ